MYMCPGIFISVHAFRYKYMHALLNSVSTAVLVYTVTRLAATACPSCNF